MSYFKEVYKKLFQSGTKEKQVLVHELIKRDHRFKYYYDIWQDSEDRLDLVAKVKRGYDLKLKKEAANINVHILNMPASNGIAITYDPSIDREHFHFLFDWIAESIEKNAEYKREVSDRIVTDKINFVEVKEKHYLKPIRTEQAGLIAQLFGNIQIEHITVNDTPSFLKIQANTYTDRLFAEAQNFDDLLKIIFEN